MLVTARKRFPPSPKGDSNATVATLGAFSPPRARPRDVPGLGPGPDGELRGLPGLQPVHHLQPRQPGRLQREALRGPRRRSGTRRPTTAHLRLVAGSSARAASGGGDTTAPSVPTGLNSPTQTTTSVSLAWNASTDNAGGTGVAGYDVYRNGDRRRIARPPPAFTVTGLSPSTTLQFTGAGARQRGQRVGPERGPLREPRVAGSLHHPAERPHRAQLAEPDRHQRQPGLERGRAPGANCTVQYRVFRGGTQFTQVATTSYTATGLTPSTTYQLHGGRHQRVRQLGPERRDLA